MSRLRPSAQEFTLGECAGLVSTDPWRIRNFVTAANAFQISPELRPIEGAKTRTLRYFSGIQVARMSVALLLTEDGFTPKTVTEALKMLTDSHMKKWLDVQKRQEAKVGALVLLRMSGEWRLISPDQANEQINRRHGEGLRSTPGFYLLRVTDVVLNVRDAILTAWEQKHGKFVE